MNNDFLHRKQSAIGSFLKAEQLSLLLALVGLCVLLGFLTPMFFTVTNIMNLLKQASIMGIAAIGVCFQILMGEIDLSIGAMQAAAGCLMVFLLNSVVGNFFVALIITLLAGSLVGFVSSFIVTKGQISSFITTLGIMSVLRGTTFVLTQAAAVENTYPGFDYLGTGMLFGIPVSILIFIVLLLIAYYILKFTTLGRKIYAIGGNKFAARLSGLNVDKIKIIVFMIAGALVAFTAVITASRMNSGQPTTGTGFELYVISAVILGGVSMTGGRGNLFGAIIGIVLLNVLSNGLVLLNVSSFYQEITRGVVIIGAVLLDEKRKRDLSRQMLKSNI